jgi:hypothetical protein
MLSHHFPTFRKLASAMAMAGCLAFSGGAAATDPAAVRVAEFQLLHGVRQWPRLQGCGYDRAWIGVTGTVLTVRTWLEGGEQRASGETALQRDSTCHVPIRHRIESWPADLGPGTYVVAATVYDASQHPGRPWRIQLVGVDRGASPVMAEAMARYIDGPEQPPASAKGGRR